MNDFYLSLFIMNVIMYLRGEIMNFSKNLLTYRTNSGISRKQMADIVGVSLSTYTNYEAGNRSPNIELLPKIAAALHVSIDDLLGYKAPNEHQRLVELAQSWGLVVTEKDNNIIVSLAEIDNGQLNKREQERWKEMPTKPLPPQLFDNAIQETEKLLMQRNIPQILTLALDNLECEYMFS